jgi:2-polyprenyl-6-methoxyphenol hydroxylase-like FAD-dependent oxidoreductase
MQRRDVLISGGGIAGLTLAILLKQRGFEPLVIEREAALPTEGYMMDFFGTGWDVAERMGLIGELRAIRYPIDRLEFINAQGRANFTVPIERLRRALDYKYVYLRRSDLAGILYRHARAAGVEVRFGTSIETLDQRDDNVKITYAGGGEGTFALVFGADGIHSRVRELAFGPERQFERFLGYYVAAFHLPDQDYHIGSAVNLYETPNRLAWLYPLGERRLDATYVFRHDDIGRIPAKEQLAFIRKNYRGAGWLAERLLEEHSASQPLYFDPTTQIVMPQWHHGRVALVGDTCGALTLLAGQGSHMAMAGALVLAEQLAAHRDDHAAAFETYRRRFEPEVAKKQRDAAWFAGVFVPTERSWPWLRRAVIRFILSPPIARYTMAYSGAKSVLDGVA